MSPAAPPAIRPTTFVRAPRLSAALGCDVVLASEAFQLTGSFKVRAAHQVATHVPAAHLLTASSGNFGQALAYACHLLGKRCTVVMPQTAARVKQEAVREYGAAVELVDVTQTTREARVAELAAELTTRGDPPYVASPYDDPLVIAGNASLGRELAAEAERAGRRFAAIVVPVGGGGLSAGVLTGLRAAGDPTPVFAAEPLVANDLAQSLRAGRRVRLAAEPATLADGARTRAVGAHPWAVLERGLAGVLEVPEPAIAEAVRLLFELANLKAEPTGALAVGALLTGALGPQPGPVCCIVSGGNVDPEVYRTLLQSQPGSTP